MLVVIYIETKASLGMGTYQLLEMVADQGRHVAVQQHRHLANLVVVWSDAVDLYRFKWMRVRDRLIREI